jgi:hypothetical protein
VLGKTQPQRIGPSRDGSGEKPIYIMHESLNRSMHFALKETDCNRPFTGAVCSSPETINI